MNKYYDDHLVREGEKIEPFYVTFVVQNHQSNHLPPADLNINYLLAQSALYRKKPVP